MFSECSHCGDTTWCSWYGGWKVCGRASCLYHIMCRMGLDKRS